MSYMIHPGNGRITPNSSIENIDAGTLASLYGLSVSEYVVGTTFEPSSIHLTPRQDGKYKNIKTELHDNGLPTFTDEPAFMHKTRDGRYKSKTTIQPQYKDSFRDGRNDTNIL